MTLAPETVSSLMKPASRILILSAALSVLPSVMHAQTGKWTAVISQLSSVGGSADLSVEVKDEKQSKVKISIRSAKKETRLAWDIVEGRCRDDGTPIAPGASFRRLQTAMDGTAIATVSVPRLVSGKSYYFRVYDPQTVATDGAAYGCGNISELP